MLLGVVGVVGDSRPEAAAAADSVLGIEQPVPVEPLPDAPEGVTRWRLRLESVASADTPQQMDGARRLAVRQHHDVDRPVARGEEVAPRHVEAVVDLLVGARRHARTCTCRLCRRLGRRADEHQVGETRRVLVGQRGALRILRPCRPMAPMRPMIAP